LKKRIDLLLVDQNIAESRSKAQSMIMAGQIFIEGKKVLKSGELYQENIEIIFNNLHPQWVSRGALKLICALEYFKIDVNNFKCLDIGASTGGFTDVLLSKNVKKIFSVDVGTNQLHEKLINNPKVINIQKTNARYLDKNLISEEIDLIVCDVSFISMKKVIEPNLLLLKKNEGIIIALIKPQFESEKHEVRKGGLVKDDKVHKRICNDFKSWFSLRCKMKVLGIIPSPIKGPKGNVEFLICARK